MKMKLSTKSSTNESTLRKAQRTHKFAVISIFTIVIVVAAVAAVILFNSKTAGYGIYNQFAACDTARKEINDLEKTLRGVGRIPDAVSAFLAGVNGAITAAEQESDSTYALAILDRALESRGIFYNYVRRLDAGDEPVLQKAQQLLTDVAKCKAALEYPAPAKKHFLS